MTSPRPDSRYLATSPITTDLSQRLTNLTVAAPGGYQLNSARTAISGTGAGRAIELTADIDDGQVGVIVDHGTGASYRIRITAGGVVEFSDSTGLHASITAPNVDGFSKPYVIAWSTEPNPLTTGAGDALRSEFLVYDVAATGTPLAWESAVHSVSPASATGTFTVGGVYTGGAMTLTYSPSIDCVRISCKFHPRTMTREHFVAQTSAPANTGIAACQAMPPPPDIFGVGSIAGPGYQAAAASAQPTRDRYRTLSPVWQWQQTAAPTNTDDLRDSFNPKHVFDLELGYGGAGWQTPLGWLGCVEVPRECIWLLVRVSWATWRTDAMVATDKVSLRFNCSDDKPASFGNCEYQQLDRTVDDGSVMSPGVNQTFDFVQVVRDGEGLTYVWVAARTDDGSGSGNASYIVRSIAVMPVILPDGYGGVVNGWGP